MKVILLAAGYGTRLYPLTKNTPKALLKINNKSILDRIYTDVQAHECYLVTNNKFYDNFVQHANGRYTVLNDGTISNEDRLGAVGDIVYTINKKNIDDDILIVNTDNMFGFNINDFVEHAQKQSCSIAACKDMKDPVIVKNRFGVLVETNSIITEFQEKPELPLSTLASVGLYYIKRKDLGLIKNCAKMSADNTGDMIKHLVEQSQVGVWKFDCAWSDVGTHDSLNEASKLFE